MAPVSGAAAFVRAARHRAGSAPPRLIRLASLLALLASLSFWPQFLQAHALLVRADPPPNAEIRQPPSAIRFWFSEPLEETFTSARVLRADGTTVPTGAPVIDPDDPTHLTLPLAQIGPGIYTVVWQTLSRVDGHEWVGSFPLTILNADGTRPAGAPVTVAGDSADKLPGAADALLRWLSLLGAALLVGPLSLRWLLARPAAGAQSGPSLSVDGLIISTAIAGALGLILSGWLQFLLQALRLGGIGELFDLLLATRPGNMLLLRQTLLAGVIPLLYPNGWADILAPLANKGLFRAAPSAPPYSSVRRLLLHLFKLYLALLGLGLGAALYYNRNLWLVLVVIMFVSSAWSVLLFGGERTWGKVFPQRTWATLLTGAALFTMSASSHAAAAGRGRFWAIAADFVHLTAAVVWAGGLIFLAFLLLRLRRLEFLPDSDGLTLLLRRYSLSAQVAVFVLALTGLFSSFVQLPTLSSLVGTTYGRVLLLKLGIVAAIMVFAFLNNRAVQRATEIVSHAPGLRNFARRALLEAGMAAGLMVSVAVLVQTPSPLPNDRSPPEPLLAFNQMTYEGDLAVHLQVTPNRVGHNRYLLHLSHPDSSDIGEVQLARLFFEHESEEMGQARLDLADLGEDTFGAEGPFLNRAGAWNVSVYVRRRGMDDLLTEITVPVPSPQAAQKIDRSPWRNPVSRIPAEMLVGALLLALSLVPLLWRRALLQASRSLYLVLAMSAIFFFLGGALLSLVALSHMNDPTVPAALPAPPPITAPYPCVSAPSVRCAPLLLSSDQVPTLRKCAGGDRCV